MTVSAGMLPKSRWRGMVGVILGLLAIVPLLGVGIVYLEHPRLKQQAFADVNAIASLKAGQIEAWLDERRGDAMILGASPGLIEDTVRMARDEDVHARQRLVERFETIKRAYAYDGFVLVDGSARRILSLGLHDILAEAPVRRALQTAFQTTQLTMTDLYLSASGHVHLDLVAPLVKTIDGARQVVGAVILDTPVESIVFPVDPELADTEPERRDPAGAPGGRFRVVSERIAPSQGNRAGIQPGPRRSRIAICPRGLGQCGAGHGGKGLPRSQGVGCDAPDKSYAVASGGESRPR
jgi:hypothetical protein